MQEIFNLENMPDEETTIALALSFWNVSLDLLSKGKINLNFTNPKKKGGVRFNIFKFFKENYKSIKDKNRKERYAQAIS